MKSYLALPLASALLLVVPGQPQGQETQPYSQWPGHARMVQNADESAQSETDMSFGDMGQTVTAPGRSMKDTAYGGVANMSGETGGPAYPNCVNGPDCKIYIGH